MRLDFSFLRTGFVLLILVGLSSCTSVAPSKPTIQNLPLYQSWKQPGDQIGDYKVMSSLGDMSIALKGNSVYAPSEGDAYLDKRGCVYFSSADTPAYLFRFCGVQSPNLGHLQAGQSLGRAEILQFATLLRQADGKWAIVEPDKSLLERTLKPR